MLIKLNSTFRRRLFLHLCSCRWE